MAIISLSRFASAYDDHFLLLLLFFHHKTTLLGSWKKNLNKRTFFLLHTAITNIYKYFYKNVPLNKYKNRNNIIDVRVFQRFSRHIIT